MRLGRPFIRENTHGSQLRHGKALAPVSLVRQPIPEHPRPTSPIPFFKQVDSDQPVGLEVTIPLAHLAPADQYPSIG